MPRQYKAQGKEIKIDYSKQEYTCAKFGIKRKEFLAKFEDLLLEHKPEKFAIYAEHRSVFYKWMGERYSFPEDPKIVFAVLKFCVTPGIEHFTEECQNAMPKLRHGPETLIPEFINWMKVAMKTKFERCEPINECL